MAAAPVTIGVDIGQGDVTVVAWVKDGQVLHSGELDSEAQLLYDQCPTPKPTWEQLGEVTKSVWRDRVLRGERAELW